MAIPRIAITPGEPAGIGPDILLALAQRNWQAELVAEANPVPLPERACEILRELEPFAESAKSVVFIGPKGGPMSNMAMPNVLKRAKAAGTVHGFRSSFRDWAGDETSFPAEVIEAALAHAIPNKAEAAYRRKDALEKRRKLMEAWAAYIGSEGSELQELDTAA